MNIKSLTELANQYNYGQYNILDGTMDLYYLPEQEVLCADNFYANDLTSNNGSCHELSLKAKRDIKNLFPQVYVTLINGRDNKFFKNTDSHHTYLLLSKNKLFESKNPGEYLTLQNFDKIMGNIIKQKTKLFDPSLRKVVDYADSGYIIYSLFNIEENEYIDTDNHAIFHNGESKPLSYGYKTETLVSIHYSNEYPSKIGLRVIVAGDEIGRVDIKELQSSMIKQDPNSIHRLTKLVNIFANTEIRSADKNPEIRRYVQKYVEFESTHP